MEDEINQQGFDVAHIVPTLRGKYTHVAMAKTASMGIQELVDIFVQENPDAILTIADRYETLGTAVAASYLDIPLVHTQGGEVTGSIDNRVRNAVTQLADIHFTSTEKATKRVREMRHSFQVHQTGCPSIDLAARIKYNHGALYGKYPYGVIMLHPCTDESDEVGYKWMTLLGNLMTGHVDIKEVLIVKPNFDAGGKGILRAVEEQSFKEKVVVLSPKDPEDFLSLINEASLLAGNSSMGIRECSYLGVPAIDCGRRQNGRERSSNVLSIYSPNTAQIVKAIDTQVKVKRYPQSYLYGDGTAGRQMAAWLAKLL
jgi:UDP-hydrolysing UDP-N-acetyl-D-glucosamine 2-epimerase